LLLQPKLGIVTAVASAALSAAMPSINKGIAASLDPKSAKASRGNRTAAQTQLVGILKLTEGLRKGTDEIIRILAGGNRPETTQVHEADLALLNAQKAWTEHSKNYAALAGQELAQAPASEVARPLFLLGKLGQLPATEEAKRLFVLGEMGQLPATEEAKRLFVLGELGRSRKKKRAARLGWLDAVNKAFLENVAATEKNLETITSAMGIQRVTAAGIPPAVTPPVAPPAPPAAPVVPGAPALPAPVKKPPLGIPLVAWIGGGLGLLGLLGTGALLLRRPRVA